MTAVTGPLSVPLIANHPASKTSILQDHFRWMGEYVSSLPRSYFNAMHNVLDSDYFDGQTTTLICDENWFIYQYMGQITIRLSQAVENFLPWVEHSLPLKGKHVVEIGCGTGTSTAALARRGAHITALDISAGSIRINRTRLDALGFPRQNYITVEPNWLTEDHHFDWSTLALSTVDVVVAYALIEHLMPTERLVLLRNLWRGLPAGAHLIVFETPNRLAPMDWHSTHLPFWNTLPDDLAAQYANRSTRSDVPSKLKCGDQETMYRFGRGASFHEFDLALEAYEIVADFESPMALDRSNFGQKHKYTDALKEVLANVSIHKGFAAPSLDLIIRKI